MPHRHIIDTYTRQNTRCYCYVYSKLLVDRRHNNTHTIYTVFCYTLCQDNIVKTLPVAYMRRERNIYVYIYIYIYNLRGETSKLGIDGRVIFK